MQDRSYSRMLHPYILFLSLCTLLSCTPDSPAERFSRARADRFKSLNADTEARLRKVERLYDVAMDDTGTKTRVFNGYLFSYTYRVGNATFRGRDRTRYRDYTMFDSKEEVDTHVRQIEKLSIRYDTLNPHQSLVNLELTFAH